MRRPEAPLALYRRYRPDTFADVIGQEHVTEPLQRALTNNRVNHAYLFSGPRGCGKTTSARILARALNCANGPSPVPCGECQSCRDLARGGTGSIDVIEIDAASHGGVDDARDLRERAFFAPVSSRYKIYIVDEAHMVTTQGFNALLKVVEEPPPHVKFIFATTEPEKVIGTIRSRTHHYPFRLVPPKTLSAYLGSLCKAEGVSVDAAALPLVVRAGAGSVRDSLSVLDQLLGGAGEAGVTYTQAAALLGYTPDALLDEIVDAFAAGDAHAVFAAIDKVLEVGQDPRRFAEDLLRRLRDLIIVAAVPDALSTGLVDVAADQAERLRAQAGALGAGELTRAAEVLAVGLTEMRGTTAPRLHLELMCARVLLPAADANDRGVHARLDRLERRLQMTAPESMAAQTASVGGAEAPESGRPRPVPDAAAVGRDAAPASAGAARSAPDPWQQPPSAGAGEPRERAPSDDAQGPRPAPAVAAQRSPAPARSTPAAPTQPSDAPAASSQTPSGGALTTVDFRRLWPEILDEVKNRRRFTWILLSQHAHVVDVVDGVLSLGLNNAGARDSFGRGGSEDVLRESVLQVTATPVTIQVVIDSTGADEPAPPATPGPAERPAPLARNERPAAAEQARQNIRTTSTQLEPPPPEDEPSRDDQSIAEESANHDELLAKHLGAELIAEED
ncbi:MAG: DNA polymerase III subunit gamma and tau [Micropruina sp.]|nr:DNA polymerase III subunit gamma and tau [Micropruina sp.]